MQSEQQQRIMGYFIEEAKDHLNTIEQGLLNLQSTIEDPDLVHEVFRAAHSVKGGAAMLGLDSIQKTAHRLEDYFKVLKECPVPVDQKLESLFLRIFDTLQELVEQLQGPFGLTDDNAVRIMGDVEPVLGQLNDHLKHLVDQSGSTPPAEVDLSSQPISTSPSTAPSPGVDLEDSALRLYFQSDVPAYLREMLQHLKQPETSENRNQLQHICSELAQAGDSFDLPPSWNELILTAQRAIANPDNSFRVLAPAIIKDFKHAQEIVLSGNSTHIIISETLRSLAPMTDVTPDLNDAEGLFFDTSADDLFADSLAISEEDAGADLFDDLTDNQGEVAHFDDLDFGDSSEFDIALFEENAPHDEPIPSESANLGFSLEENLENASDDGLEDLEDVDSFLQLGTTSEPTSGSGVADAELKSFNLSNVNSAHQTNNDGPEVGAAELNSLADLFENESTELEMDWQEEVIHDSSDLLDSGLELEESSDFSDLLFDESYSSPTQDEAGDDISDLLSISDSDAHEVTSSTGSGELDDFFEMGSAEDPGNTALEDSQDSDYDAASDVSDRTSELDNLGAFFSQSSDELERPESELAESYGIESEEARAEYSAEQDLSWDDEELFDSLEDSSEGEEIISSEETDDSFELELDSEEWAEDPTSSIQSGQSDDATDENLFLEVEGSNAGEGFDSLYFDEQLPNESAPDGTEASDLELELDLELGADDSDLFDTDDSPLFDIDTSSTDELNLAGDLDLELRELDVSSTESSVSESNSDAEDFELAMSIGSGEALDLELDFTEMEDDEAIEDSSDLDADFFDDAILTMPGEPETSEQDDQNNELGFADRESLDLQELLGDEEDSGESAAFSDSWWSDESGEDAAESVDVDLDQLFDSSNNGSTDGINLEGMDDGLEGMDDGLEGIGDEMLAGLSEPLTDNETEPSLADSAEADLDSEGQPEFLLFEESDDDHQLDDGWGDLEEASEHNAAQEASALSDDLGDIWIDDDASAAFEGVTSQTHSALDAIADELAPSMASEAEDMAELAFDFDDEFGEVSDAESDLPTNDFDFDDELGEVSDAESDLPTNDFDFDAEFGDLDAAGAEAPTQDSSENLFEDLGSDSSDSMGLDTLVGEVLREQPTEDALGNVESFSLDEAAIALNDRLEPEDQSDADADELFFDSMEQSLGGDSDSPESAFEDEFGRDELDSDEPDSEGFDFDNDFDAMLDGVDSESQQGADEFDELSESNLFETELDDELASDFDEVSESLTSSADDDFDNLEALLDEPISASEMTSMADVANGEDLTQTEPLDEFDDLEALLDEAPISAFPEDFEEVEVEEDDFADLEKLLEDADQKLGGSPTAKAARGPSPGVTRRPARRTSNFSDQTMRVPVKNLDNLNNLVGELVVNRNSLEQSQERSRQFLDNLLYQVQQLSDVGQRMRDLYERSLLESSLLSSRRTNQMVTQVASSATVGGAGLANTHATGASFDALEMDRFTGFHTLSQEMIELIVRVREASSDIDFVVDESDQITRMFRQVTTQLQEGLTRSRMVPFAQAATRLPRAVRDISIKCGKQAEMVIEGKDTLIDKMILEQLYDPLTHLVNNAITHGIETPEDRQAIGKPDTGKITLRVFHQGNQTIISVSDDGAGIDPDNVKRKAIERGLILAEEASDMSDLETYDLLFHHGFSTRDKADDFAGRGVGMDVVRTSLNEIRGVVNIDSVINQGTTFTIRLPLTLSISKALLCVSNRARIAFPMDGVEDMLDVPRERIQTDEQERSCIQWRELMLPFQPLDDLLRYNRSMGRGSVYGGNQEDDVISVVVLRSAGNYLALQVDQVLGEQEIVIKQLEAPVPKPAGIAGATVLGDGRIMPIADVLELIDLSIGRIRRESGNALWDQEIQSIPPQVHDAKSEPTVLIVDDSITVRELLSMTFNKVGYRVEQARDGQEAWEKLKSGLPCDLVFCDIEMPRMDGLELLSRLQKDGTLKDLPIAMLTSRGADRHRQMAVQLGAKGYFTKPYLEEALLDAAQRMLNGEVLVGT